MDLQHIKRLEEEQKLALSETDRKIKQWEAFRSDYDALRNTLTTLPDKITHDVMVPFGPLAFMPGKLVHTNEILVLLGDNWFVDRSAKQATEIIGRRIKTVQKQIEELQAQKHLLEPRLEFTKNLPGGSVNEDYFEITEEYNPEKENLWREEHRKSIQRQRNQEKAERESAEKNAAQTDEDIWRRLDDLERQEAEGRELQRISDEASSTDTHFIEKLHEDSLPPSSPPQRTRRVHFKEEESESSSMEESDEDSDVVDSDDFTDESDEKDDERQGKIKSQVINFTHSGAEQRLQQQVETQSEVKSPRDIYRLCKTETRSILKSSDEVRKVKVKKKSDKQRATFTDSAVPTAFSGLVVYV
ncbi:unconventional prefoldin RPB5 interactor-like isoform X2 [Ostrea edulis]|uniref:unconventional prefoldin RPB5 interactor-like isoform X2 n=1 Tax=Ostrea edulis TaxID=37623 RepID=UPI0024AFC2D2|nr:unconventional prefoldin RPB5 interactor-like isoform X2 [Ostrea edulis]